MTIHFGFLFFIINELLRKFSINARIGRKFQHHRRIALSYQNSYVGKYTVERKSTVEKMRFALV